MPDRLPFLAFETRAALCEAVADTLAGVIAAALETAPRAAIALSGGSTPGPAYRALAARGLDWSRVDVALVDDRWVAPGEPGSNETLLREAFAGAVGVTVHGLWRGGASAEADAAAGEAGYASLRPFCAVLLGMGGDAHTASWFPGSAGLADALDPGAARTLAAIDATGCPGAQSWPHRVTLTLSPVAEAGWVGLMLTGDDKRAVLAEALGQPVQAAPVRAALEAAGSRAAVFWAA
jgi:6-phosphogluconolactonase